MLLKPITMFNHSQDTGIKVVSVTTPDVNQINTWTTSNVDSEVLENTFQTYLEEDSSQDTLNNYRTFTGQNINSVFIVYFSRDSVIDYPKTENNTKKELYIYFNRNSQYLSNDFNPLSPDVFKLKVVNVEITPGINLKSKQAICLSAN